MTDKKQTAEEWLYRKTEVMGPKSKPIRFVDFIYARKALAMARAEEREKFNTDKVAKDAYGFGYEAGKQETARKVFEELILITKADGSTGLSLEQLLNKKARWVK
jgi:hypothetical protein